MSEPVAKKPKINHAASSQTVSRHLFSKVADLVRYLKDNPDLFRLEDLAIKTGNEDLLTNEELFNTFKSHERVMHETRTNLWRYKPDYDIRSKADILRLLKSNFPSGGLPVKTLKESWASAPIALEELERQGKVLLTRTTGSGDKDGQLKLAFYNEVGEVFHVDKEFKDMWHSLETPDEVELPRQLQAEGLRLTAQASSGVVDSGPTKKKKKSANRRVKITNTHLKDLGIDLSKDFVPEKKS